LSPSLDTRPAAAATAAPLVSTPQLGRAVLIVVDVALIGVAVWLGYVLRFEYELFALETFAKAPVGEYVKLFVLLAAIILLFLQGKGLFHLHSLRSTIEETAIVIKSVTIAVVLVATVFFFYRRFSYSRTAFAYFLVSSSVMLAFAHAMFRRWQLMRYRRGLDRRRAALVGKNPSYLAEQLIAEPAFGLEVMGFIDSSENGGASAHAAEARSQNAPFGNGGVGTLVRSAQARGRAATGPVRRLGGLSELVTILDSQPIEELIVVDQDLSHDSLLRTIDACEARGVKVRMVPQIYDLLVGPEDFTYVHNVPIIRVDERRYHRMSRLAKRLFDTAVSAVLLAVTWPLALVIMAAIRLESKGPALFVQVRAGEGGKPFGMYKFRTMVEDAEGRLAEIVDLDGLEQPAFKIEDDPRITRVGRFLRRWSLDELPQLWNVLKGDMSLVGPRPEELRVVSRYDVWQRRRLKVKPGITGLQQVEARGALSDLNDRVRLDVYYIRKQSVLLDLVILLRTIGAVVRGRGAT
jgi:exopolysaccharide biosynthesis polyprenyl glycosylphosphotransferase